MEIRHLQLVKTVAEEGNLTKAAEKLHLSQSALSHQLRVLEEEINVSVFHRINKKLVLTQAGKLLLNASSEILDELAKVKREVERLSDGETGMIRLSTECYTCYHWLPPILKQFFEMYPKVEIEIKSDRTDDTIRKLLDNELDIGIVEQKITDSNIASIDLFVDEMVCLCSPEHVFSTQKVVMPADLKEQVLITHAQNFEASTLNQKILRRYNITPSKVIYIQLTEAALEMVKANLGVTVLPRWVAQNYKDHNDLICRKLTKNKLQRKWKLAYVDDPLKPAYLEDFIQIMRKNKSSLLPDN